LNWSVPLTDPLQDSQLPYEGRKVQGLEDLLQLQRVDLDCDPLGLVLHIAMPHFDFLDRGKGSAELGPMLARAVAEVTGRVVKEFADVKRKLDREQNRAARLAEERLRQGRVQETSVKDAAWEVMREQNRPVLGQYY
jgi:hypothetical protein